MRFCIIQSCAIDDTAMTPELLGYLCAIGSYATQRNSFWCWQGQPAIAERMGVTRQAVSKALLALESLGYIEIKSQFDERNGKQVSNAYRLIMDFVLPPERDRSQYERPRKGVGGRKKSSQGATDPATVGVAPPATVGVAQNLESESENGNREVKPAPADAAPVLSQEEEIPDSAPPSANPDDFSERAYIWRRVCDHIAASLTDGQMQRLRALRLFQQTPDDVWWLMAPNPRQRDQVLTHYTDLIGPALDTIMKRRCELVIDAMPAADPAMTSKQKVVSA